MHVLINYSTTDDAELHDDGTIVLDSEEEPLEEKDGSRELNRIPEKESGNEHYQGQDCSSRPSGTKLHNEDNTIVLDSEEEQLEEGDDGIELNPISEEEPDNEQDSSSTANNNEEGDNSTELDGTITNATHAQSITCNEPEIYSESDVQNAISCGDFGRVVQIKTQVNLTDHQKFCLLQKHFVPSSNYKFPIRLLSSIPRRFQHSWLKSNPGLVYSESQNGGYCKYCVLFGKCEPRVKELGIFVNRPFTNFKKASELLGRHFHGIGSS